MLPGSILLCSQIVLYLSSFQCNLSTGFKLLSLFFTAWFLHLPVHIFGQNSYCCEQFTQRCSNFTYIETPRSQQFTQPCSIYIYRIKTILYKVFQIAHIFSATGVLAILPITFRVFFPAITSIMMIYTISTLATLWPRKMYQFL